MEARSLRTTKLRAIQQKLGPLVILNFDRDDLPAGHRKLGEDVRPQVWKILNARLGELSQAEFEHRIRLARRCRAVIVDKTGRVEIAYHIREALSEYLVCLSAWAEGARLYQAGRDEMNGRRVDELPITEIDLALFLQNDETGCQTGALRLDDGSVAVWHTEENVEDEIGSRFDRLRIASFRVGDEPALMGGFIYPDLLPGPAFSWRTDTYFQAVDSLFLKRDAANGSMLANVAAWVTLRLGGKASPVEVIRALGPFLDGYAIQAVSAAGRDVLASKVEFAAGRFEETRLERSPGSYLVQANIFSRRDWAMTAEYEGAERGDLRAYEARVRRMERAVESLRGTRRPAADLVAMLASREGGSLAYANEDVRAYVVSQVSPDGLQIWLGAGPALPGDELTMFRSQTPRSE